MANKITSLGGTDWVDGEVVSHTDLIDTIERAGVSVQEVYTGDGFNVSGIVDTDDYELDAIVASKLTNKNYVKIFMTISATANSDGGVSQAQIKLQAKETGGDYADEFGFKTVCHGQFKGGGGDYNFACPGVYAGTIMWYHTLTEGEKINGCQFKVLAQAAGARSATITNISTVVEVVSWTI